MFSILLFTFAWASCDPVTSAASAIEARRISDSNLAAFRRVNAEIDKLNKSTRSSGDSISHTIDSLIKKLKEIDSPEKAPQPLPAPTKRIAPPAHIPSTPTPQ